MELLGIDQLEIGMVVDENVVDKSGRMLLPAGKEISEKHIRVFKTWGVMQVKVHTGAGPDESKAKVQEHLDDPESPLLNEAKAEIDALFVLNEPAFKPIQLLRELCTKRALERLLREAH